MQLKAALTNFVDSHSKSRIVFLFAISLLLLGIPYSRFLMSMGGAVLVINWFLEGNLINKARSIFRSKVALSCLILYVVHLLWMLGTQNMKDGWFDLWTKTPLLFLPIIFFTSQPLSRKECKALLQIYVLGAFISSVSGFILYHTRNFADMREMALFISYVRFTINICFAGFVCLYLLFRGEMNKMGKAAAAAAFCWFLFFLVFSGSITAIALFFIAGTLVVAKTAIDNGNKNFRYIIPPLFVGLTIGVGVLLFCSVRQYFIADFSVETAAKHTLDGNPYSHNPQKGSIENGSYIFTYISEVELEQAWNKRSEINYTACDEKGFAIKNTLIRYLNSKGLHKDRLGVEALSEQDISNVEHGIANVAYTHKLNLVNRIYSLMWEMNDYWHTGSVLDYSVPQRFELWKHSISLIKKHPYFGVGTGDAKTAFAQELQLGESPLANTKMRSHNQYFTFLIAFGTIGLLLILFSVFYPVFALGRLRNSLFLVFFCMVIISMFTEDTLEPQDGVTFFAFFYYFFLFLFPKKESQF